MDKYLFFAGYFFLSVAVSAAVLRYVKRFALYALISATVLPFALTAADAVYRGYIDSWSYPAFVIAWFISLGCAVAYYFAKRAYDKRKQNPSASTTQS